LSCPGYCRQAPYWGGGLASVKVAEDCFFRCWCWWEAIFCAVRSSKPGRHRARMLARCCGTHKNLTAARTDRMLFHVINATWVGNFDFFNWLIFFRWIPQPIEVNRSALLARHHHDRPYTLCCIPSCEQLLRESLHRILRGATGRIPSPSRR